MFFQPPTGRDTSRMKTIKHTLPDGTVIEVPLPEGFVHESEIGQNYARKDTFMSEVDRRAASIAQTKLDEMLGSDAGKASVLQKLGIDPAKLAKGGTQDKDDPERITRMRQEWENGVLAPVQGENKKLSERVKSLTDRALDAAILQAAADAGVRRELLKAPAPGAQAPIVAMTRGVFALDGERDEWFVKGERDGFAFSAKPSAGSLYKGVSEFFSDFVTDKANGFFVDDQRQRGPNMEGPGGPQGGGPVRLTREQASDAQTYRAAMERAEKSGTSVEVVD